jgi:hypothetical protein
MLQTTLCLGIQQLKHVNEVEVNLHPFQTSAFREHDRTSLSAHAPSPKVKSHRQIFDRKMSLDMVNEIRIPELPEI